jgi:hypothetical protein
VSALASIAIASNAPIVIPVINATRFFNVCIISFHE